MSLGGCSAGIDLYAKGASGGGAPAWSPTDLGASLVAWWKADAEVLTDGDGVYQWNDQSGNGRNLTQSTGAKKPQLQTNVQNGLPAVVFDGIDDWLQTLDWGTKSLPNSYFLVMKRGSTAGTFKYAVDGRVSTARNIFYAGSVAGSWNMWAANATPALMSIDTAPHVFGCYFTSSSYTLRNNGAIQASGALAQSHALTGVTVAAGYNASGPSPDTQFEIIVIDGTPTTQEESDIESYLNGRWAIY